MKPNDKIDVSLSEMDLSYGITEGPGVKYRSELVRIFSELLDIPFSEETDINLPILHFTGEHKILIGGRALLFRSDPKICRDDFSLVYGGRSPSELVEKIHGLIVSRQWISPLEMITASVKFSGEK